MNRIEQILNRVEKPARYTGGEVNSIVKATEDVRLRFAFAFPDLYEIGMSYTGLQILYHVLNERQGLACERVFAPAKDMEAILRSESIPLFTLETKTPLRDMDFIGFTLQYELSYTNVLNMLDLSGIPIKREERGEGHPLVIAGGPCAFNPEPLTDFIDLFLIGDGEESLPALCDLWLVHEKRETFLEAASKLQGIYVPSVYDTHPYTVRKSQLKNLDKQPYPLKPLVPFVETVHDRAVLETFRGCTRGCRFCQAGMIYRPVRERRPKTLLAQAEAIIANTGHEELSLLSLSTSDYSKFEPLVTELMDFCGSKKVSLSLPSMRLDSFSFKVLQEIQKVRKSGLTFAPEAGTQRLRDVINKSITEEDIYGSVRQAISLGWQQIKLYFMIGLPTETDEDLDGIAEIAHNILKIHHEVTGKQYGRFQITISVSNFVPKAHTPFQWAAQATEMDFRRKHDYLGKILPKRNCKYQYHDAFDSILEGVFARGGRECGRLLLEAWRSGCSFDGWSEHLDRDKWREALASTGISIQDICHRTRTYDEKLPWEHIDSGVSIKYLIDESEKAVSQATTLDCRKGCTGCGIC